MLAFATFLLGLALGILGTCVLLRRHDERTTRNWPNVGPH